MMNQSAGVTVFEYHTALGLASVKHFAERNSKTVWPFRSLESVEGECAFKGTNILLPNRMSSTTTLVVVESRGISTSLWCR